MANHMHGEVEIQAGEKKLIFRLGVNEMIELQGALGLAGDDEKFAAEINSLVGFNKPRLVVLHGLKRAQPDMTEADAGDILTEVGMSKFALIYRAALRWALPEPDDESKAGGEPRPSGGPTSS